MNRPIATLTPDVVPYQLPTERADGTKLWDPLTFTYHRLPLTNRLGGYIDLKSEAPKPNGTKRARRKPKR